MNETQVALEKAWREFPASTHERVEERSAFRAGWSAGRLHEVVHCPNANAAAELDSVRAQIEELKEELDSHRAYSSEMLQAAWLYRVAFEGYRSPGDGEMLERNRKRLFASISPKHPSQAALAAQETPSRG